MLFPDTITKQIALFLFFILTGCGDSSVKDSFQENSSNNEEIEEKKEVAITTDNNEQIGESQSLENSIRASIFYGNEVDDINHYPFSANIGGCSATFISPEWLLSAAHCWRPNYDRQVIARYGQLDYQKSYQVNSKNIHTLEAYRELSDDQAWGREPYDIALIELVEPVNIGQIALLPNQEAVENEILTLVGRGASEFGYDLKLREANLRVGPESCSNQIHKFCAFGTNQNLGSAGGGDSGGGAYRNINDFGYEIAGITSTSNRQKTTTFTEVQAYLTWIKEITGLGRSLEGSGNTEQCASEGEYCYIPAGSDIMYGYEGNTITQHFPEGGAIYCSNEIFGNPAPGRSKACYIQEKTGYPAPESKLSFSQAEQINTGWAGLASYAIDGNIDGRFWNQTTGQAQVTHTQYGSNAWWEGTLSETSEISKLVIYNRTDCCRDRLIGTKVYVSKLDLVQPSQSFYNVDFDNALQNNQVELVHEITSLGNQAGEPILIEGIQAQGQYIYLLNPNSYLHIAEVEAYGMQAEETTVYCAKEWEICQLGATGADVIYGMGDKTYRQSYPKGGDVPCTNAEFGDPAHNISKQCYYVPHANGESDFVAYNKEIKANTYTRTASYRTDNRHARKVADQVGYIKNGTAILFEDFEVPTQIPANYFSITHASNGSGGDITLFINGVSLGTYRLENTGGWRTSISQTFMIDSNLSQALLNHSGTSTLELRFTKPPSVTNDPYLFDIVRFGIGSSHPDTWD